MPLLPLIRSAGWTRDSSQSISGGGRSASIISIRCGEKLASDISSTCSCCADESMGAESICNLCSTLCLVREVETKAESHMRSGGEGESGRKPIPECETRRQLPSLKREIVFGSTSYQNSKQSNLIKGFKTERIKDS